MDTNIDKIYYYKQVNMKENSPIKKRILQAIDLKNITKYEFYKKSGITRGILDQNNGISEENIARLLEYMPDINANWLLTGKEPIFSNSSTHTDGSKNIVQSGRENNVVQGKNNTINKGFAADDLQTLKFEHSLLEREKELLSKENDLLKREIELLKREFRSSNS